MTSEQFDFSKIRLYHHVLVLQVVIILLEGGAMLAGMLEDKGQLSLMWLQGTVALVSVICQVLLWKEMGKSVVSTIVHGWFVFIPVAFLGGLPAIIMLVIPISQAEILLKNKGNVKVTFWGVKALPKKKKEEEEAAAARP